MLEIDGFSMFTFFMGWPEMTAHIYMTSKKK